MRAQVPSRPGRGSARLAPRSVAARARAPTRHPGDVWPADLHCHTAASFDSQSPPEAVVRAAIKRGLRILAITDHDRLDGAMAALEMARGLTASEPSTGLDVIVGEEIRSRDGDIIGLYLSEPIPSGMSARETIQAIHEQGGLAGAPHPFDRHRGTALAVVGGRALLEELVPELDYVESANARVSDPRDERQALAFAARSSLPGIRVSDAHTLLEVGTAWSPLTRIAGSSVGLRDALNIRHDWARTL